MPRRRMWYSNGTITVIHTSKECPFFQNILSENLASGLVEIDEDRMPIDLENTTHHCESCEEIAMADAKERQERQRRYTRRSR